MKNLWVWITHNTALSFFLSVEAASLMLGLWMGISPLLPKSKDTAPANLLVTVSPFESVARTLIEPYNASVSNAYDIQLSVKSEADAIQTFMGTKNAMLLLSRPLTATEMALVKADQLPLTQDTLVTDNALLPTDAFLISTRQHSPAGNKFLAFLNPTPNTHRVFLKKGIPRPKVKS
jgi:hypothetical protein